MPDPAQVEGAGTWLNGGQEDKLLLESPFPGLPACVCSVVSDSLRPYGL